MNLNYSMESVDATARLIEVSEVTLCGRYSSSYQVLVLFAC